jgi:hypothetical protein
VRDRAMAGFQIILAGVAAQTPRMHKMKGVNAPVNTKYGVSAGLG